MCMGHATSNSERGSACSAATQQKVHNQRTTHSQQQLANSWQAHRAFEKESASGRAWSLPVSIAPACTPTHPTPHPALFPTTVHNIISSVDAPAIVRIQQWAMRCFCGERPGAKLQGWGRKRAVVEVARRSVVSAIPCNCQAMLDRAFRRARPLDNLFSLSQFT
jgi:hypothetical protein